MHPNKIHAVLRKARIPRENWRKGYYYGYEIKHWFDRNTHHFCIRFRMPTEERVIELRDKVMQVLRDAGVMPDDHSLFADKYGVHHIIFSLPSKE